MLYKIWCVVCGVQNMVYSVQNMVYCVQIMMYDFAAIFRLAED
jgi:hypothetical protein